jgi:sialic acid synthase
MKKIKLTDNRYVGDGEAPYLMAEIGINHNGNIDIAKELIYRAKNCGADAVKFQKRSINEMYTLEYLNSPYLNSNSFGATYGEHKKYLEFSDSQLLDLQNYAQQIDIDFNVSGFDKSGFEFINNVLKVPFHKVASPLINHHPLVEYVASFGKPLIISTGMHSFQEVKSLIDKIKKINNNIILLQCTTSYPTPDEEVNLSVMKRFRDELDVLVGYSSHDKGVVIPAASIAFGGCFVEKHYTLDRTMKGADHISSVEDRGLELISKYMQSVYKSIGVSDKNLSPVEEKNRLKHSYSCVSARQLDSGTVITEDMVEFKQPGGGILPKDLNLILGKTLNRNINADHKFDQNDF